MPHTIHITNDRDRFKNPANSSYSDPATAPGSPWQRPARTLHCSTITLTEQPAPTWLTASRRVVQGGDTRGAASTPETLPIEPEC